jgi:tripartite-type tricarboxylate transporter receptor subunit TctC
MSFASYLKQHALRGMVAGLAIAALACGAAPVQAQTYPDRPIHVVIGFPAGSGADILGRYFTHKLEDIAKQPVIVDNKPGATSNIAVRFVANAKPDGYTILFVANSNMAGSRYLFKDLPFDTIKDFKPAASFAEIAFVVVVSPKSKITTYEQLVAKLKSKKDNLYGYTNQTAFLSAELFKQLAGVEAKAVAYKTAPDTMRDITDETLDFVVMDGTFAAGQIRQGALRPLAVTTSKRSPSFPDTPTMAEVGLKDFDFAPWWCAYLPKDTPQPIIDKVESMIREINRMPETAKFLESVGSVPRDEGQKESAARLLAELPKWEKMVKAAGIEPQ